MGVTWHSPRVSACLHGSPSPRRRCTGPVRGCCRANARCGVSAVGLGAQAGRERRCDALVGNLRLRNDRRCAHVVDLRRCRRRAHVAQGPRQDGTPRSVDARLTAGGHADPTEVLRWRRGDASDPWATAGTTLGCSTPYAVPSTLAYADRPLWRHGRPSGLRHERKSVPDGKSALRLDRVAGLSGGSSSSVVCG